LLCCAQVMFAQKYKTSDYVYIENIRSVKCHPILDETRLPLIPLKDGELKLSFDDLNGDTEDYRYLIQYCNADWSLYDGSELEYINGYNDDRITSFHYSFGTFTNYTHYDLVLPSATTKWTRSGNYLLQVYRDDDEGKVPILTRRFMVFEDRLKILGRQTQVAKVSKTDSHQEIDFEVNAKNMDFRNPKLELKLTVLQNGRWDNAITGIPPTYARPDQLIFDEQDKIVFPAEREYRPLQLSTLRSKNSWIQSIRENEKSYDVTLKADIPLENYAYIYNKDANGEYIIRNFDLLNQNNAEPDWQAEYTSTLFSLSKSVPYENADVYVCGHFTDYQLYGECKMIYDEKDQKYYALIPLKQGYYNYKYALVPKGEKKLNTSIIDGNWYETENQYTSLLYYHPIGTRYDQLIGWGGWNTLLK
jgi:hypothetical protein